MVAFFLPLDPQNFICDVVMLCGMNKYQPTISEICFQNQKRDKAPEPSTSLGYSISLNDTSQKRVLENN